MTYFLKNCLILILFFCISDGIFAQDNHTLVQEAIETNSSKYGLTSKDVQSWEITDSHADKNSGISYYYVTQKFNDLLLHNAISVVAIKDQKTILTSHRFIPNLSEKVETATAKLSAEEAILLGAKTLGLSVSGKVVEQEKKTEYHFVFSADGLSKEVINVRLKLFQLNDESVRAVWDLDIYQLDQNHWWSIRVDAQTGELLDKIDWVSHCDVGSGFHSHDGHSHKIEGFVNPRSSLNGAGYNVFAIPVESPNHGSRSLEIDPENLTASPYGWHDINGIPGPEFTTTFGNNVYASEDRSNNNTPGYSPDGGSALNFNFPLNLNQHPQLNEDAVITNLFYMNNIMHDVWYQYGFNEASGNFQNNNYGKGGLGDDHVFAEAQDGGGSNNANFATPPDGYNPRMQMYLWSAASPSYLTVNSPSAVSGPYSCSLPDFGPPIPSSPLTADLVLYADNTSNPSEACQTAVNSAALNGKIAVIRRGDCSFTVKVQNAENAGAIAVIVINNVGGGTISMGGTDPGIGIPSVMISMADGADLIAEIQNGSVVNATLQMTASNVPLDGDFDNVIIAHEYGHGISIRLTGGASESGCLSNDEQMGEGWSDWFGLMLTIEPGDQEADARGIGTYASGELPSGGGIRPLPYSTDFNVNFITYGYTNNEASISEPHGIGFVWASMLWDLTWALIDKHGMDPDVYNGTGGNNIAMHLVIQGLKLQGCDPGFIDGRDAILLADELLYNGQNACLIWEVFAKRGLGYSADQGSPYSRTDQTEAFDLPPYISPSSGVENVVSCGDFTWPTNNQTYTNSGSYTGSLMNAYGCDSIVTLNLTINTLESSSIVEEVCDNYTWSANNQTYSNSGVYTGTLNTVDGCDSIVTLNLTIQSVDTDVTIDFDDKTLLAASNYSNYQWVDCKNGYTPIQGANTAVYAPTENGSYAVIINDGNCSDTSSCISINTMDIDKESKIDLKIYPNPTNGMVNIDFMKDSDRSIVKVYDMTGKLVQEFKVENQQQFQFYLKGESGIYTLEINSNNGVAQRKRLNKLN